MPEVHDGGGSLDSGEKFAVTAPHPTHSAPELLSPSAGMPGLPRQTSVPLISKQAIHRLKYPSVCHFNLPSTRRGRWDSGNTTGSLLSVELGMAPRKTSIAIPVQIQLAGPTGPQDPGEQHRAQGPRRERHSGGSSDKLGVWGQHWWHWGRGVGGSRFRLPAEEIT